MSVQVDIWLRGQDFATTRFIEGVAADAGTWSDEDVRLVLEGMLQAMYRLKHPDAAEGPVVLRGLSWIVNPFESGFVIAIEITMGAAVAGPFDVDKTTLEAMISRVLNPQMPSPSQSIH